ncbi:MAG: LacI family transcriptional regulator [Bifidobacteriaceae bacterium]|jgi:DNA-binding LacI/PurR family transcriptional regulator|nr:LacI family transcriptional regulator [Bifidobacteriaceae bacterium]
MSTAATAGRRKVGPSIEDVARLAGVSAQTVSRVSTGSQRVRPNTRNRVLTAMDQLGYSPNQAARALRSGTFGALGLLAYRFERTGEALTTQGVVAAAEAEGYSVTLVNVANPASTGWRSAAARLSDQAVDGLIIIRAETETPETLALPAGLPVAVSDSRLVGYYPAVVADQIQGSIDAVGHLLELGHRTVHHIAGPSNSDPGNLRRAAWQRRLEEAGIVPPEPLVGDWTAASGYAAGQRLAADPAVTAVYCANDEMALGLLRALYEAGRKVPDEVSIVGFDGIALGEFVYPPLTTVAQDYAEIGRTLVKMLLEQVRAQSRVPQERVMIPTELIVRGTTAPPPS